MKRRQVLVAMAVAVFATVETAGTVTAATLVVPGDANIFGAGHLAAPNPGGAGSGLLPAVYSFQPAAGSVLTFSSVTGRVRIDNGEHPLDSNGPDGGSLFNSTEVWSFGGVSGVIDREKTMFLVGVFLDDSEPSDPAPPTLDFSSTALTEEFASLSPQLRQVFFIGDGRTVSGSAQQYTVPAGATRLFLGFADSWDGATGTITGYPGWYDDNDGAITVNFSIVPGGGVVTLAEAVDRLTAEVREIAPRCQPQLATLLATLASIERGDPTPARNQLTAFQNKVRAQVSPWNFALADEWITKAQQIINWIALESDSEGPQRAVTTPEKE